MLDLLLLTEREGAYSDVLLSNLIKSQEIDFKDRKLLTEIFYGTIRNKIRIDSVIYDCTTKKKKIDDFALNLMRLSVYQLMFLDKVPDFAVINEAVNIMKSAKRSYSAGFVNAVLRNVTKKREGYLAERDLKSTGDIADYFSFPKWLSGYFIKRWGSEETLKFFAYSLTPPKLTVRRTHRTDNKTLERLFDEEGVACEALPFPSGAYNIVSNSPIGKLNSHKNGMFIVQSAASSLITRLLAPEKGEVVLDLCSAPGTKTVQIAACLGAKGRVFAADLHFHRLLKLKENIVKYGLKNIHPLACDASFRLPFKEGFLADKILLDVPCSGLGVIQKSPEIKYRMIYDDIARLADIQYKILESASGYLRSGGKLVYSTCTMTHEENEGVVKKFLENNRGFVVEKITDTDLIKNRMVDKNGFFRTIPHLHLTDGFFAAVIVKK